MKLTDGERLIVVMLAEMMEGNKKREWEMDPALIKTLAINKDDWAIARKFPGIFDGESPSDDVVRETTDILWMWGIIEHALSTLKGTDATEAANLRWKRFAGFDANNDPHFGVAHTLINDLEQFQDFKGRDINSHTQATLPRYRTMRVKFERHLKEAHGEPLTLEALQDLCA